jgi:hypothetical protein
VERAVLGTLAFFRRQNARGSAISTERKGITRRRASCGGQVHALLGSTPRTTGTARSEFLARKGAIACVGLL